MSISISGLSSLPTLGIFSWMILTTRSRFAELSLCGGGEGERGEEVRARHIRQDS